MNTLHLSAEEFINTAFYQLNCLKEGKGNFIMMICFTNKTKEQITIEFKESKIELESFKRINADSDTNRIHFNCSFNESSTLKHLPLFESIIICYNFIVKSSYNLAIDGNYCEIDLIQKQVKGKHLENYKFADIVLRSGNIKNKAFYVQDELLLKEQLSCAQKRESKINKVFKILNILQSVCNIGIPTLIIFFGLWYFANFQTALLVIIPLTVTAVLIGLLLKYIINKLNRKSDKFNSKSEIDLYVNTDSFFNKDYIYSVLNK